MTAYYNEVDKFAAAWLRELIAAGHIAPGVVDERPIQEVKPSDVEGFTQCHFFAGIAVWSHALRAAGWSDDRHVWTGSCPCQPFSAAGKRGGVDDERHLWPEWFRLIRECAPDVVFGEQVSSKDGLVWFDAVSADLEAAAYAVGALDTCAAGVGAPHKRQRLYFVADRGRARTRRDSRAAGSACGAGSSAWHPDREHASERPSDGGAALVLADNDSLGRSSRCVPGYQQAEEGREARSSTRRLRTDGGYASTEGVQRGREHGLVAPYGGSSFWADAEWIYCRDGKYRAAKPGIFPLASGIAGRVGLLRGAGNSLCAPQAQAFIEAYLDVEASRDSDAAQGEGR